MLEHIILLLTKKRSTYLVKLLTSNKMVLNSQKDILKVLILISFQFSMFLTQPSAKASGVGYNYYCATGKYLIKISSGEQLTYYAFNDTTTDYDYNSFERTPDLTLKNGRFYYKTKNKLIMTWRNDRSYFYQVTIVGPHDVEGIGYPSSGNIIVKRHGQRIIRQSCLRLDSGDPY
jgi:hypothetical protein